MTDIPRLGEDETKKPNMFLLSNKLAQLLRDAKDDDAKRLLTRYPALTKFKGESGRSVVHFAAVGGSLSILKFATSLNLEAANEEDDVGWTPLMIASSAGRSEIVRYLISLPNVNVKHVNITKQTSLHYACSKNHIEIVKMLIGSDPECINLSDEFGATALHRASSRGHETIVRALLATGRCTINKQDSEGNTALHLACDEDRFDVALLLLNTGAEAIIYNKEKITPLQLVKNFELREKLNRVVSNKL